MGKQGVHTEFWMENILETSIWKTENEVIG